MALLFFKFSEFTEIEFAVNRKDKRMLQRLHDIMKLPEHKRSSCLLNTDHFIKASEGFTPHAPTYP